MSAEMTVIGGVQVRRWPADDPKRLVVLVHGYGEHIGRYAHVAEALAARGSTVVGPDHVGHGRSAGERVLVESFEPIVDDLHAVVQAEPGDLSVVMVGHSMGGLIAICYAQRHREDLAGLVLSGPAVGLGPVMQQWLAAPEPPSDPLDATALSPSARRTWPTRWSTTAGGRDRRPKGSLPPARGSPKGPASGARPRC